MADPISLKPVRLPGIAAMRDAYRRELDCQIVHDSYHERGFVQSHCVYVRGDVVGYGSIETNGTVREFYVVPDQRARALELFRALLVHTSATAIEAQSNDPLLMPMLQEFAADISSDRILFAEGETTSLSVPDAAVRRLRWLERPFVFKHSVEPKGDWGIEYEGQIVATGGLLFHYNPPYGDIYMEVEPTYRRRGFGSLMVQELKRIAREGGHVPAARCNADNIASQSTLLRAGMRECGRIFRGNIRKVP